MSKARIGAKHHIRERIAGLPTYWDNLIAALDLIDRHLGDFGMTLDNQVVLNLSGTTNTVTIPIETEREYGIVCSDCDKPVELDNWVVFSYYKMPSGRYEITAYVS